MKSPVVRNPIIGGMGLVLHRHLFKALYLHPSNDEQFESVRQFLVSRSHDLCRSGSQQQATEKTHIQQQQGS
eukprot:754682-Hanusia_phi.AAC.1